MIDNVEIIKPLLNFESEDDFYFLQILQRKKDNPNLGSNSRVIKNYYITSVEHLQNRYEEIKILCNTFNARASIRLNKRSFSKVGFKAIQNIANSMSNKDFKSIRNSYDRACGVGHNDKNKTWILDFDETPDTGTAEKILELIENSEPIGEKIITFVPSLSHGHSICKPFDLRKFKEQYPEVEIHKDNPTNLYIP